MRLRRHGDANTVRKRGPASDRIPGVSARTWSRFKRASLMFQARGGSVEDFERLMEQTKRRNGKYNISALLQLAEDIFEGRPRRPSRVIILPPPPKD
jgi:hypothetical protein